MRVTAILVLAIPASAAAQSRTLGSPLAAPPDAAFGCETKPALTAQSFNGDYFFVPSGVPDCTWFQSGVIGSVDYSDPRTGSVPADGTITNVTIRTGDTPAAMGIVIVRQIGGVLIGGGSTSVCCAFVSETPLPAMAPRTTNSFPVNIPVERNIRGTSAVADYVGISALSNTGFLPLLDTGDNNTLTGYRPGSPDAGFFYPRMGATEAPGGGTRNNESIPNVEVLLQWTWTPAGGVPTPPVPPQQPPTTPTNPGAAAAPTPQATAAANARRALIQLACGANAACQGQLELLSRAAGIAAKPKLYGKATYALAASQSDEVKVKLNRKGKALLRKRKNATVSLRLSPTGGTPVVSDLKLKR